MVRRLGLIVCVALGACEDAVELSESARDANIVANSGDGGGDAGERADGALLPQAGMYHLPDTANVTTLELKSDGTFRWIVNGCDYGGGDVGRWITEDGDMVLLPRTGRDQFRWPGEGALERPARVVLRRNAALNQLDAEPEIDGGSYEQSWLPGAWCAQCGGAGGGQLGPTGTYACDDPFADSRIDY